MLKKNEKTRPATSLRACCRQSCVKKQTPADICKYTHISNLHTGYAFNSARLHLFKPDRVTTARAYPGTVIPVSPQGKTGISQTQACARKDEIPARRFAWPE
ncbi:MAG TPA: hypothetical protein ENJ29_14975 [Bacteroidetes bacterium]|nr:hypothetical protein [Bacteroidota bacterium]